MSLTRLEMKVKGRPAWVFAQGPSLERVMFLKQGAGNNVASNSRFPDEAVLCSINRWNEIEWRLRAAGRAFTVLFVAAKPRIAQLHDLIATRLLYTSHLLLTRPSGLRELEKFVDVSAFRDKILPLECEPDNPSLYPADTVKLWPPFNSWHVPSVGILTVALLKAGASEVILFGADGGPRDGKLYADSLPVDPPQSSQSIPEDTRNMNQHWQELCELSGVESRVRNATPGSDYACWPIIEPDEVLL